MTWEMQLLSRRRESWRGAVPQEIQFLTEEIQYEMGGNRPGEPLSGQESLIPVKERLPKE